MKRLLCILSSLDAGGAETFLMKIYRALPTEEYQMDFVVSVGNGCYTEEVTARGGRIYQIPERTRDFFGSFRGLYKIVKENRYEAVLKLGETPLAVTDLLAAKLGGATCLALRACNAPTGESKKARILYRFLRPWQNRLATVKLAPSQLAGDYLFGNGEKVRLIHNGVDLKVYRFDEKERQKIREDFDLSGKLVVGHVGRMVHQKNHRFLLEIFKAISEKREDAVLLLVGMGPLEEQLRHHARQLGLENKVIFAGRRFDIPAMLSAMDVFVFPSFHEGMPNTVVEAQATGLPCLIADTITREADLTGLVLYASLDQSPEEWAEKALSLVSETRACTGDALRNRGYDIASVARELMELMFQGGREDAC